MIITDDLNVIDDSKEATKTARSTFRSKLIELLKQVDDNKRPQIAITENAKQVPSLYANWVKADTEQVFTQTVIPTKKQEDQQVYLEKGISVIDEE